MDLVEDAPSVALRLPQILGLNAAAPLAQELASRRGRDLMLDGSAVERLGGQCLQVLLSAKATWEADGLNLTLCAPSDELTAALQLLGAPVGPTFQTQDLAQ